jgi:hypothetical protein
MNTAIAMASVTALEAAAKRLHDHGPAWLRRNRRAVERLGAIHGLQLSDAIEHDLQTLDSWKCAPPDPQRFHGSCFAVTSLSPAPHRQDRQQLCVESWQAIGLPVIAVNSAAECALLSGEYPGVTFRACDDLATDYDRPTQRVSSLIQTALEVDTSILLINSDIQIWGDPQILSDLISQPGETTLAIGVRWNHAPGADLTTAKRERWGLDAFVLTPEMAATVPRLPFAIGRPVWDWWLPTHFRDIGYSFRWLDQPWLYHELHALAWSQTEWDRGAAWLQNIYGLDLQRNSQSFRKTLR